MADEMLVAKEPSEEGNKMFSQEEVEKLIKKRLKNKDAELAEKEAKLAELNGQIQSNQNSGEDAPEEANNGAPDFSSVLNQKFDEFTQAQQHQQQEAALHQQLVNAHQKLSKMTAADPKFAKLVEKSDNNDGAYQVNTHVGAHILNTYPDEKAKDILNKLMTNQLENLGMQNAILRAQATGTDTPLEEWLGRYTKGEISPTPASSKPSVDLTAETGSPKDDTNYSALDNYLSRV